MNWTARNWKLAGLVVVVMATGALVWSARREVPTPYYAAVDASGAYKIGNVPDGSYTVTAWREGMKAQSKPIAVAGAAKADFTLAK